MSRRFAVLLAVTSAGALTIPIACDKADRSTAPPESKVTKIEFTVSPNDILGFAVGDTGVTGVRVSTTHGFTPAQRITVHVADTSVAAIARWGGGGCGSGNECEPQLYLRGVKVGTTTVTVESGDDSASIGIFVWGPHNDYEMIDLGTLGGDLAYPVALNDSGHVVGYSTTASGVRHAFLWSSGFMRDLGTATPGTSVANTITNSDRVGIASSGVNSGGDSHVFAWSDGTLTELGKVSAESYETGIVGMSNSDVVAWTAGAEHYFSARWHNGVKEDLGGLYGPLPSSRAHAMNARGQIVGGSLVSGWVGSDLFHPFVWENGVMRALAVLAPSPCPGDPRDCSTGEAIDINSDGTIVGASGGVEITLRAVLWRDGNPPIELGFRRAVAINDSDDVVGNGNLAGSYWQEAGPGEAYFWHHGVLTNLGSLGRGRTTVADINDQGVVVGASQTIEKRQHAFAWKHGQAGLIDLGTPLAGSAAVALNARGDIIGWAAPCAALDANGACSSYDMARAHAVLWRVKRVTN